MCQVNDVFFENLTEGKIDKVIEKLKNEKPDLRLSTLNGTLGEGIKGYPKSEVI